MNPIVVCLPVTDNHLLFNIAMHPSLFFIKFCEQRLNQYQDAIIIKAWIDIFKSLLSLNCFKIAQEPTPKYRTVFLQWPNEILNFLVNCRHIIGTFIKPLFRAIKHIYLMVILFKYFSIASISSHYFQYTSLFLSLLIIDLI